MSNECNILTFQLISNLGGIFVYIQTEQICIFKVQGFKCQFPRDTLGCECVVYVLSSTGKDKEENNITETDSDGVGVTPVCFVWWSS